MRWMWIDSIVGFEPERRMVAIKNVSLAEEHLHDHFEADGEHAAQPVFPASLMIEGMAQTAGILVGSVNRFREKVVLAKVLTATIETDVGPGHTIRYEAELERIDQNGASTHGRVSYRRSDQNDWRTIGRVDLLFSHLDNNRSGLAFPEENFVFSDNFRTILAAAGLDHLAEDK